MARPRSDIQKRVVLAARALFLERGVEGASLRDIAARAKTNIGMVYYYFPTKGDLFEAVVGEVYPGFVRGIEEALAPDVSVHARIERLFVRMGNLSEDEVDVVRIVLAEVMRSPRQRDLLVRLGMRGHVPAMLETIAEGVSTGVLVDDVSPMAVALSIFAPAVFAQLVRRLIGESAPRELQVPEGETLARALAHLTLGGIGRTPTAQTARPARNFQAGHTAKATKHPAAARATKPARATASKSTKSAKRATKPTSTKRLSR